MKVTEKQRSDSRTIRTRSHKQLIAHAHAHHMVVLITLLCQRTATHPALHGRRRARDCPPGPGTIRGRALRTRRRTLPPTEPRCRPHPATKKQERKRRKKEDGGMRNEEGGRDFSNTLIERHAGKWLAGMSPIVSISSNTHTSTHTHTHIQRTMNVFRIFSLLELILATTAATRSRVDVFELSRSTCV